MGANVMLAGLVKRDQALWLASHADPISAQHAFELGLVTKQPTIPIKQLKKCLIHYKHVHLTH